MIDIENDNENTINSLIFFILKYINNPPIKVERPAINDKNKGPIISIFILK
jgi:hypothetical protein